MTLAVELVRAVRALARQTLPAGVTQAAKLHLLDALGVGLAAAGSAVGAPYRAVSDSLARGGPATVLGATNTASAADAALVNGGLMHSLEYDDTHVGSIMHGSSVLAAAALAGAQAHGTSGAALLGAYARGWEVLVRFGLAAPGRFHARGFQATSVAGTLAAALVAAELGGLGEVETEAALGIALSQASGVMEFLSNGSSVKSLHPGWAAHGGILAAVFASAGMSGPKTAIEGANGLFRQFTDDAGAAQRFESLLTDLGTRWHLPEAAYKFFPCCHYLHPFIEAAGLLVESGVRVDQISEIICGVPAGAAPVICEPWARALDPVDGHAARWSLPVTIAARLVDGKVDLDTFELRPAPAVLDLARKLRWQPLQDARFPERFEAVIHCTHARGALETVRVHDVDGNHTRPPSAQRVRDKFRVNATRSLTPDAVVALERACDELDLAPSTQDLAAALACVRAELQRA